jgi:prephenate dehydratase
LLADIFATAHEAGQLFKVLRLFAEAKIILTRIASMPQRSDPGNYSFFLDCEGDAKDEKLAGVMKNMKEMTIKMKFLGSYPAHNE